jgi:hypothetical protein
MSRKEIAPPTAVPPQRRDRLGTRRAAVVLAAAPVLVIGLAACSAPSGGGTTGGSSSSSPGSPSSSSSSGSGTRSDCSAATILAALPTGATMEQYDCARAGDTEWAAARVEPGNTVFFLQRKAGAWDAMTGDDVCGTASAGLPEDLLAYCSPTSSSPTPAAHAECSTKAILAALPSGATMERYTCAKVGGTEWAAARVGPGSTVFFLTAKGSTWQAMTADTVCGAATAGLPQSLLAYCTA